MFQRITRHIHMRKCEHYTDRPNIGHIRGERGVLLFDAGNSGAKVRAYLELLDTLDFTHCVSGHSDVKTREHQFASLRES